MTAAPAAVTVGAATCLLFTPYLAGLSRTVPDRADRQWWRPRASSRGRLLATAATGGVLGALTGAAAGWNAALAAFVALAVFATPLVLIDFEHHRLPDRLVGPAAAAAAGLLALAAQLEGRWSDYLRGAEAAGAVLAVLGVLWLAAPRSFGLGDVKLGGVLGGYLGWTGWSAVYYGVFAGFLLGSLVGIALMATRRATLRTALAFGPMLLLGALLVLAFDLTPSLTG